MKAINREKDSISLSPTMDRDALWMTIHGASPRDNRVVYLSLREAVVLADTLRSAAKELQWDRL